MTQIRHKIPESQKDRKWRINLIKTTASQPMKRYTRENDKLLLSMCAGHMDYTGYNYITNPMNMKDSRYTSYPAKLRNWDIISPITNRIVALHSERNHDPIVFTKNSNFDSEVSEYQTGLILNSLQQRFVNKMVESGRFDPMMTDEAGNLAQPPESPEVIKQKASSVKDLVTIEGQHVLNYVLTEQNTTEKYQQAWEMFIKLNRCMTYKHVMRDKVVLHHITPDRLSYSGNNNVIYLEDCEKIVAEWNMNFVEVMEIFQDVFEEEEYKSEYGDISKILEERMANSIGSRAGSTGMAMSDLYDFKYFENQGVKADVFSTQDDEANKNGTCLVQHVQVTSFRKVGKIFDESTGGMVEVTEDYLGDDVLEWSWYPEQRDGYIIDNEFVIGGHPTLFQPSDPDDPFYSKKNYNGRIFMQGVVRQLCIPEKLATYQEAYNVLKWKIQMTINKNKDKITVMPIGLLGHFKDTEAGNTYYNGELDEDGKLQGQHSPSLDNSDTDSAIAKSLFYADALSMLFVDETSENAALAAQMLKSIDLGLGNYIQYLINYCALIKAEAEELVGFNRFMMAKTSSSDPVGNTQSGMYTGSLVIEQYFTEFQQFLNREYQGILDRGRFAFRSGFKSRYVRNSTDVQTLEVTEAFANHVYGVFTQNGNKTKEVTDTLKQKVNEMLQNGTPASVVARVLSGTMNFTEIIQMMEEAEDKIMKQAQATNQANNDAVLQNTQLLEEGKEKDRQVEYYKADMSVMARMLDANMEAISFAATAKNDELVSSLRGDQTKLIESMNQLKFNYVAEQNKKLMNAKDNETKRYVADKAAYVARVNKN